MTLESGWQAIFAYHCESQDANSGHSSVVQPFGSCHRHQGKGEGVGQWPSNIEQEVKLGACHQDEGICHWTTQMERHSPPQVPQAPQRIASLH